MDNTRKQIDSFEFDNGRYVDDAEDFEGVGEDEATLTGDGCPKPIED